jgi:hypothetical protein
MSRWGEGKKKGRFIFGATPLRLIERTVPVHRSGAGDESEQAVVNQQDSARGRGAHIGSSVG